jgi:hypothetical protein
MKKPMSEKAIKDAMRLYAIEWLVTTCFALLCVQMSPSDPLEPFGRVKKSAIDGARKKTLPDFDPAMSDHLTAELEVAVVRLLGLAEQRLSALKPP